MNKQPGPMPTVHLISPDFEHGSQTILCNAAGARYLRRLLLQVPHCSENFGIGAAHANVFAADGEGYTLTLRVLSDEAMQAEEPPYVWKEGGQVDHWTAARDDEDLRLKAEGSFEDDR